MGRQNINQLKETDVVSEVYQVTDKTLRPNKNGNLYIQFTISDRTGTLSGRFWNATEELFQTFETGDFIRCEGAIQRYQGNLQFIAKRLTKVPDSDVVPDDFARSAALNTGACMQRIKELLHGIKTIDLRNLVDCFLADETFVARFIASPAGVKLHHAYKGGLLEHTLATMELVARIAPLYPHSLNYDLLLTGAFLHDVGKIEELACGEGNNLVYTDRGQLLGHSFLAAGILRDKIEETEKLTGEPFPKETAMLLEHFLISHHGTLENGSTKLPMTQEAMVLHYVDSMDAKIAEFQKHILDDPNTGTTWTNYIPAIERKLYTGAKK
ncbi:MAG: OB-fold nucleic acid binding domain-containing protein [Planctomycetia bacterium]|nr:OB-fold nucleic acid binding domain-containing protein [Planctomycetia bacterium]